MHGIKQPMRTSLAAAALSLGLAALPARAATPTTTDEARTFTALQRVKAIEVMHLMDEEKKGYVTREEFLRFQEQLFDRMNPSGDGKVDAREFTGKQEAHASGQMK
jgi:hypothetical protein